MVAISRNSNGMLSKSKLFAKSGRNKRSYSTAPTVAPVVAETLVKTVGGAKNGGTRTIPTAKALAFYPSEDVKALKVSRKTLKPTKLRSSITPGTVLIMLAGRFRGKRVVCLKQLPGSGLLLITGPYKINGVPLRRVNACYVIATSTKVDISSVVIDEKINDAYFSKDKAASRNGTEAEFFKAGAEHAKPEKKVLPASKAADQKVVDKAILAAIAQTPNLNKYLSASFGLSKGQYPHLLKF